MTFDLLENRRGLFPIVAPEPTLYIHNKKSSRSRAREKRRYLIACQVQDKPASLYALQDDYPLTRWALFDIELPTARRKTRSPAVQDFFVVFVIVAGTPGATAFFRRKSLRPGPDLGLCPFGSRW